ncbi:hypothetical protein [Roseicyclus marinus]|nr:hypothetical protein [Roseicyclus marinus]MDG3040829.1 hypothetical protein [Roseicyclus marinus]
MAEQPKTPALDPDEALRLLDEAWAYFTPGPRPAPQAHPYEDLPLAA